MNNAARDTILSSIRSHLEASVPYDKHELRHEVSTGSGSDRVAFSRNGSLVDFFKQNLEAVGGHCTIAQGEPDIARALTRIIGDLQKTNIRAQRIAISDAPVVEQLLYSTDLEIEELAVAPNAA